MRYNKLIRLIQSEIIRSGDFMVDYFSLYKTCLQVISEKKPDQLSDFIDYMSKEKVITDALAAGTSQDLLIQDTLEVVRNLFDDGLIRATL